MTKRIAIALLASLLITYPIAALAQLNGGGGGAPLQTSAQIARKISLVAAANSTYGTPSEIITSSSAATTAIKFSGNCIDNVAGAGSSQAGFIQLLTGATSSEVAIVEISYGFKDGGLTAAAGSSGNSTSFAWSAATGTRFSVRAISDSASASPSVCNVTVTLQR